MITIINKDGVSNGTIIKDENGNDIKGITAIDIKLEVNEPIKAKVELFFPLIEMKADEEYIIYDLSIYPTKYLNELKSKIQEELGSRYNDNKN